MSRRKSEKGIENVKELHPKETTGKSTGDTPAKRGRKSKPAPVLPIKRNLNVFVAGDLLIDHTVFVDEPSTDLFRVSGEDSWRVKKRMDTAGGASTTARTINNLSDGATFLWGLVGESPWGSFRAILDNTQSFDGAANRIEFRGVMDETNAPMTTVSRIVSVEYNGTGREQYIRKSRFSDFGKIHVPIERQKNSILYHLQEVDSAKKHLDAIILNDLDLGALHSNLVNEFVKFAQKKNLPVLIRARRDGLKYAEISDFTLVCTLAEWRFLVRCERQTTKYWVDNIDRPETAEDFAIQTFNAFPKVKQCAVLVGDSWIDKIIILEKAGNARETYEVSLLEGLSQNEKGKSQQVGASDVFTGGLVFGLCRNCHGTPSFKQAVLEAVRVIECYSTSIWHRVPKKEDIADSSISERVNFNEVLSGVREIKTESFSSIPSTPQFLFTEDTFTQADK